MTQPVSPGWYPDPSGVPGTRYWDGQRWAAAAAPPRKKSNALLIVGIIVAVVVVVFGGLIFLGVIGASVSKKTAQTSRPSIPAAPGVPSFSVPKAPAPSPSLTTATKPPPAAIGQEARDGDTVFVVTSVDQSKVAGNLSNPYMQVTAQGQFLNVHLTVSNAGTKPQTFFAANQKLNLGGSVFEANSSAALWTQAINVSINPGNSIQVVVSFDVPANSVVNGTVQLHESLISRGAEVALS